MNGDQVEPLILRAARAYRTAGLFPIPVAPGGKNPILDGWQLIEDVDLDIFRRPNINIGLRMGPQPDGRNIYAMDIDPKHGGDEDWKLLVNGHEMPETAWHGTPSGGKHIFYLAPDDLYVVNKNLADGINTRGPKGQVVAPPSQIDGRSYTADAPIHRVPIAPMPALILNRLRPVLADAIGDHPSTPRDRGDGGAVEWVRQHLTWEPYVVKHGWGIESRRGQDLYVIRPGKTDRGHSGVAHEEGALVLFTTEIPSELRPFMRPTRDGSGEACSLFAFITAYEWGGDMAACGRYIREHYMPDDVGRWRSGSPPPDWAAPSGRADDAAEPTVLKLPLVAGEYWSACERNRHIFVAAQNRMVSPDALDAVMYAMQACLIPPNWLIESIVGGPKPVNMLACLVARTGDFKTSTQAAALDLLGPFPPWVAAIGLGSGEGIGAMFLREKLEEDPKTHKKTKTGTLERNDLKAVFFEADEGSGLTAQSFRSGATLIANLCKAWSGSVLGEANADTGRRRHVLHNDYRIGALVNIQPSNFAGLFSEANTGTGLTGRFLFSGTLNPDIPDIEPPWPGPLPMPHLAQMPVTITIDPRIVAESKAAIRARHRNGSLEGGADETAQTPDTLARMAAILTVMDERREITLDDWETARLRADTSMQCLKALASYQSSDASDRGHKAAVAKARNADRTEREYDALKTGQAVDRIVTVLAEGPMSAGNITAKLAKSCRDYRDDALDLLVAMGKVRKTGEQWEAL